MIGSVVLCLMHDVHDAQDPVLLTALVGRSSCAETEALGQATHHLCVQLCLRSGLVRQSTAQDLSRSPGLVPSRVVNRLGRSLPAGGKRDPKLGGVYTQRLVLLRTPLQRSGILSLALLHLPCPTQDPLLW